MIGALFLAGLALAIFGSAAPKTDAAKLRETGCEAIAAWELVGNDPSALDVPTLAGIMAARLDPKNERPELDELAAQVASDLLERGGC